MRMVVGPALFGLVLSAFGAWAHEDKSPLGQWLKSLRSNVGTECCSGKDGEVITDADWESKEGQYRVFLDGKWFDVPPWAVIDQPNLYGRTMVWPQRDMYGTRIRCFLPGSMG